MASNALAGRAYLKIDGTQYLLRGTLKISNATPSSGPAVQRDDVAGMDQVHGFTETIVVPSIEYEFTDTGGLSIGQLGAITNTTVTAELVNGKTYVLTQAWHSGPPPALDAHAGTVAGKFSGMTMQEKLASS